MMFDDDYLYDDDDYQDDFADQDLSKLTNVNSETLNQIRLKIKDNTDPRIKLIGDRVLVWDTSRLISEEFSEPTTSMEEYVLMNFESIVIEDNCKFESKVVTIAGDFTKNLDLKIWNKKLNKVYRTSSLFVKRMD